ncbi:alpha/beta fold hydrolase [Streptomyces sp. NBC_00249]|uniref:thioesterase II family protein n=1 Tax=Streptomyces sp. NBC_00249 TaxID=2975690 RepID=UPI00224F5C0E|nr:alpha/beta fold hydrolase [Streptomyces sp. NBC_00249]MCX5199571.1 alpha/beta fold hydrolase [Streptomyces sp. NBC_00249]
MTTARTAHPAPDPAGLRQSPWLRRFHQPEHPRPQAAPVLVVCPHAGGNASFYFQLSRSLAAHAEVLTVQYPGRQERFGEPVPPTLAAFVEGLEQALAPWREQGRPLVLFGHSMGALIAFELARRLERAGEPARGLVLSGRRTPLIEREENLHALGDEALIAHLSELAGTEPDLLGSPEMRELILPALRGDYRAVETYRYEPGPVLGTPVSVLCGESDPRAGAAEVMGWRELTDAAFTFRSFPGGHFYLVEQHEAVVRAVIEDLTVFTGA